MVPDTLHDVSGHPGVEERDGQAHQLGQEVGDEGDAYAGGHVQHQPAAYQLVGRLAQDEHHLRDEYHHYEVEVARADAGVYHGLGQERQDEADDAAGEHGQQELDDELPVGAEIPRHAPESQPPVLLALLLVEPGGRLQQQCDAQAFCFGIAVPCIVIPYGYPRLQELLPGVAEQSGGGVRDMYPRFSPAALYAVDYDEVVLPPVHDARKYRLLAELCERQFDAHGAEPHRLRRVADAQQRDTLAGDVASLPQRLQGPAAPVMRGDDAQAGRAAVHRVKLAVGRELSHVMQIRCMLSTTNMA